MGNCSIIPPVSATITPAVARPTSGIVYSSSICRPGELIDQTQVLAAQEPTVLSKAALERVDRLGIRAHRRL